MEPFLIFGALILSLPLLHSEPKTTVILLDNNATHNGIDVMTQGGKVSIDEPYVYTTMSKNDQHPSNAKKGDPAEINKTYSALLEAVPIRPESILFYFEPGTAELTQASKNQVESLIQTVIAHAPASVDIIGHSDRDGDADKNYQLALERAKSVEKFLLERNVDLKSSSVISYGENDPIVPTEDGVAEPQNRRVEVIVR